MPTEQRVPSQPKFPRPPTNSNSSVDNEVIMDSSARSGGTKRTAATSPQISPVKGAPSGSRVKIRPVRLDTRLRASVPLADLLAKAATGVSLSHAEVVAIVEHPDWEGEHSMHTDIANHITSPEYKEVFGPTTETDGEYMFEESNHKQTGQLMKQLNYLTVEKLLRERIAKLSCPNRSPCHFSKGPFFLRRDPVRTDIIIVENSKEKKCLEFSYKEHRIDTKQYRFDLNDAVTYQFLCTHGPLKMVALMEAEYKSGTKLLAPSEGPFKVKVNASAPDFVHLETPKGLVHELHVQEFSELDGAWKTVGSTGLRRNKAVSIDPQFAPSTPIEHSNSFSSLADDEGEGDNDVDQEQLSDGGVKETAPSQRSQFRRKSKKKKSKSGDVSSYSSSGDDLSGNSASSSSDSSKSHDGSGGESSGEVRGGGKSKKKKAKKDLSDKQPKSPSASSVSSIEDAMEETPTPLEQDPNAKFPPLHITREQPDWVQESESDASAACSENERELETMNLSDVNPAQASPLSSRSTATTASDLTDTDLSSKSGIIPDDSDETLLSGSFQIAPKMDHVKRFLIGCADILEYVQRVDPEAAFIAPDVGPDGKPLPPLKTLKDFSHDYLSSTLYFQCSNWYDLGTDIVTEQELKRRLDLRLDQQTASNQRSGKKKKKSQNTGNQKNVTEIYVDFNLRTSYKDINRLIGAINIDLKRKNLRVRKKDMQCWQSSSRKMLISVNSGLCTRGLGSLLLHTLKECEKRLCRHGKLSTEEWYDKPMPHVNLSLRTMREAKVPATENSDGYEYSFTGYPPHLWKCYSIETTVADWPRINGLLNLATDTNALEALGPYAYILSTLPPRASLEQNKAYMKKCRYSCGNNATTTILDCSEVMTWVHKVKVKMAEVDVIGRDGKPTGKTTRPRPPYKETTLLKELQGVRVDGQQIFHTAVVTEIGPEKGISRIVVAFDPYNDPRAAEKLDYAKRFIANLSCSMYHSMIELGYSAGTVKRMMQSFYMERADLAEHSTWNPITRLATSKFRVKADSWLEDNAHLDAFRKKSRKANPSSTNEMSDKIRCQIIKGTNTKPGQHCDDVGSHVSGASAHTGDASTCGNSTTNTDNTFCQQVDKKDLALKLAAAKRAEADRKRELEDEKKANAAKIDALEEKLKSVLQLLAQQQGQQGAPPPDPSGSGSPSAMEISGSGGDPQGS